MPMSNVDTLGWVLLAAMAIVVLPAACYVLAKVITYAVLMAKRQFRMNHEGEEADAPDPPKLVAKPQGPPIIVKGKPTERREQ